MKLLKFFISILVFFIIQTPNLGAEYTYKKLPSGQVVIVKEVRDNPIVTINTWVRTGAINEDDTNSGVAHFLEHLFFKGSKNVPTGDFDKILESKGGVTNAATSKDYTEFYITIPSKDFDTALKLHSDMLLNPLIPRKELEKERFVVLEEISRGLDSPSNVVYNNLFKLIYSNNNNNHPYKRPVIGTKEIISTIPREKIMEFYERWYTPNNMVTVISGDVDTKYAISEVEKAFVTDRKKQPKTTYPAIKPITAPLAIEEKKDVAQGYMYIGYRAPKLINDKDCYALDILSLILGGSNSSVLNRELKEKENLVTAISSSYVQYMDDGLFIISSTFTSDKNKDEIKEEIFNIIDRIKSGDITKEEVQKAKIMLKSSTEYSRESAENIANELGYFTLFYDSPKMYDDYLKNIDKVQLKDVIEVANKYLDRNKTATSTVTSENKEYEVANVAYAAKILEKKEPKVIEKTDFETKYLLDNGLTLIVRKNKSNSIIAMSINANGGSFLTDTPAIPYLAMSSAKRGTKSFDREELNTFLDQTGIRIQTAAWPDMANIALMVTKDNLKDGIKVLDEIINYPTFNTKEIEKVKKDYKDYAKSLKDKSLALALDDFTGAGFINYPYSINTKSILDTIDEVQREDIEDFYNKLFDSKNIVVTVVGNVDTDYIANTFSTLFKDKGEKKIEIKEFIKSSYIPKENYIKKIDNRGKETSWIVIAYKTGNIYNLKELATLKVIDSILGTGMSSRLFRQLRENQGLAYQVGSQIVQYGNDGAFFTYIGTNPKNEKEAISGMENEINKLKTEFVSKKELQEAKDKLLGNIVISLETNMDRAELLSKYTSFGYDLDFLDKLKEEIKNVTSTDILSFANKYFSNPHFEIVVGK